MLIVENRGRCYLKKQNRGREKKRTRQGSSKAKEKEIRGWRKKLRKPWREHIVFKDSSRRGRSKRVSVRVESLGVRVRSWIFSRNFVSGPHSRLPRRYAWHARSPHPFPRVSHREREWLGVWVWSNEYLV